MPDPELQQFPHGWHFYLHPVPTKMDNRTSVNVTSSDAPAGWIWLPAHHEFIQLRLFKAVRVVLQFDLVGLALLSVDLQEHLSVRPCTLYI